MARAYADPYLGKQFGNVRLDARIGQGGMGVVYRGHHDRFGRDVAVKLLPPHHDEDRGRYQERFLREGQAAAMIQHENVVQVFDAGRAHGVAYLVLEFVDGSSIGEVLDRKGKLEPQTVSSLAMGIVDGLVAIHAKDIVHRDIKPDNLLLMSTGQVKIADMGLARQLDDDEVNRLTATGMVVGTPLYVAPEAIRDAKNTDHKTDIYSLGATLYHMLSGEPPFTAQTPYEIMRAHLEKRVRPLREINPDLPRSLTSLIELCLNKDPAQRPTAEEVAAILRRGLEVRRRSAGPLAVLSALLIGVIIAAAFLGWKLVTSGDHSGDERSQTQTGHVRLEGLPSTEGLEYRLADGDWQPVISSTLEIPTGSTSLAVRGTLAGAIHTWNGPVTVSANSNQSVRVALAPISVQEERIEIPGDGLLLRDGQAVGDGKFLLFRRLGTFLVGRWDGQSWTTYSVDVSHEGVTTREVERSALPSGPAWYRERIDNLPVPPHHAVSWHEADAIRAAAGIAEPFNWALGSVDRFAPAARLSLELVRAIAREHTTLDANLPNRQQAIELSDLVRRPVWFRDERGQVGTVGSGSDSSALVVTIPATR